MMLKLNLLKHLNHVSNFLGHRLKFKQRRLMAIQLEYKKLLSLTLVLFILTALSCTKKRNAELPEEISGEVFALSDFGSPDENSKIKLTLDNSTASQTKSDSEAQFVTANVKDQNLGSKYNFLFQDLQLNSTASKEIAITFSIDKNYLTAYKIIADASQILPLEKGIALTFKEVTALHYYARQSQQNITQIQKIQTDAKIEKAAILAGKIKGKLLIPIFKFDVLEYGTLDRVKNSNKEATSVLKIKSTNFNEATHFRILAKKDARKAIGFSATLQKNLQNIYQVSSLENKSFTVKEISEKLKLGLNFLKPTDKVQLSFDESKLLIYKEADYRDLTDDQKRNIIADTSGGSLKRCAQNTSTNKNCVLVLVAETALSYKTSELSNLDIQGSTSAEVSLKSIPSSESVGLVEIVENSYVEQITETTGLLDPENTLAVDDLKGEFFYRRTFQDAPYSFIGITGTSGDLIIVNFEFENNRLVVRNKQSLIAYSGVGPKDKEEILSFPVKYYKLENETHSGAQRKLAKLIETTKESATHLKIDWTQNRLLNTTSPLAFFGIGRCFVAEADQKISDMKMNLKNKTDQTLAFSLNYSYTVNPACAYVKDTNTYGTSSNNDYQINFNVKERISFVKRAAQVKDEQLSLNISNTAQKAFNFGVFTLADIKPGLNSYQNRDGFEVYKPLIYDFRNGRKMKWTIGGLAETKTRDPERFKMIALAVDENFKEWNKALHRAFKGTLLDRPDSQNYLEYAIEDKNPNNDQLGDLNKNYVWFQEVPAENGNLGIAQPAANPRTGTIEAANVILQSGNMFEYQRKILTAMALNRENEKFIDQIKQEALKKDSESFTNKTITTSETTVVTKSSSLSDEKPAPASNQQTAKTAKTFNMALAQNSGQFLNQATKSISKTINFDKLSLLNQNTNDDKSLISQGLLIEKLVSDVTQSSEYLQQPELLKARVAEMAMQSDIIPENYKTTFKNEMAKIKLRAEFYKNAMSRPGCFTQMRENEEDEALNLDSDPQKNLYLNFKREIQATLFHEMGHALGLTHNFIGSFDQKNFAFDDENNPARNYSSVMDYMLSNNQKLQGMGPYDVYAIRAAYTGYVELNPNIKDTDSQYGIIQKIKSLNTKPLENDNLVKITDVLKALNIDSMVHFERETLNKYSVLKPFMQCNDMDTYTNVLCQRYDAGTSVTEIVQNKINDIERRYWRSYFVHDKINFSFYEKFVNIYNIIREYADLRSYLGAFIKTVVFGTQYPKDSDADHDLKKDFATANGLVFKYFIDVLRTPTVTENKADMFWPHTFFKTIKSEDSVNIVRDAKVMVRKPLYDVYLTQDKFKTLGFLYNKVFALKFLFAASDLDTNSNDQKNTTVSYFNFEKYFLSSDISQADSILLNILQDMLNKDLKVGFFTDQANIYEQIYIPTEDSVEIPQTLVTYAGLSATLGLAQSQTRLNDVVPELFRVGRAYLRTAPTDRPVVFKTGNASTKSDSVVFYALQNSYATKAIIKKTLKYQFISEEWTTINDKITASIKSRTLLDQQIDLNIIQEKDFKDNCQIDNSNTIILDKKCLEFKNNFMQNKFSKTDMYKSLVKEIEKADNEYAQLLRSHNKFGELMATRYDSTNEGLNFEAQSKKAMTELYYYMNSAKKLMQIAKDVEANLVERTLNNIVLKTFNDNQNIQNNLNYPAYEIAMVYLNQQISPLEAILSNNQTFKATNFYRDLPSLQSFSDKLDHSMNVLELLSQLTRFVDSDMERTQ